MSYAPTIVKQAGEARTVTFDFTNKLQAGDTIATVVGGALEATGITVSAPSIVGSKVSALVSAGTDKHRISCRVTTTQGEMLELDVDVRIADGEN